MFITVSVHVWDDTRIEVLPRGRGVRLTENAAHSVELFLGTTPEEVAENGDHLIQRIQQAKDYARLAPSEEVTSG